MYKQTIARVARSKDSDALKVIFREFSQAGAFAGNYDLALRQFRNYLNYFGNTELAASSQFHIGEIEYYNGDLTSALEAFDLVVERYPKSGKAPDALYLKAKAFEKQRPALTGGSATEEADP